MLVDKTLQASIAIAFTLCLASCGKNDKEADPQEEAEVSSCESTADCDDGMVCLAGECASTSGSALYTDPASAVTPDKVRKEIEAIGAKRQKRHDELLEGL